VTLLGTSPDRPSSSWTLIDPLANLGKVMQASTWSLSSIHLVVVLGENPLGRCPSKYAAHANKIVSEPYKKEQCSNIQCQRLKQDESMKNQCDQNLHFELDSCSGKTKWFFLGPIKTILGRSIH
jgi:hypothetical protein